MGTEEGLGVSDGEAVRVDVPLGLRVIDDVCEELRLCERVKLGVRVCEGLWDVEGVGPRLPDCVCVRVRLCVMDGVPVGKAERVCVALGVVACEGLCACELDNEEVKELERVIVRLCEGDKA